MYCAVASGVPPTISADSLASFPDFRVAQRFVDVGVDLRDNDCAGVFGGATTPNHAADSKPGNVSAIVGTSGSVAIRLGVATAISLSLTALDQRQ